MTRTLLYLLLAGLALMPSRAPAAEVAQKDVVVASYRNSREIRETVGARVGAILHAQKIPWTGTASFGMTVLVPADRASEALELLAKATNDEKLPLTLYLDKGDRRVIVTADDILQPRKPK